jgi:tetratricopeptide (TPR) repeat protein
VTAICLALAAITIVVFGQTARFGFVDYDDDVYVSGNPVVQKGLTWKGAAWAFTYGGIGHRHPLTWLTHMADCQLYGLWAGGHHLTSVALHAAAAVLLLLALKELTGSLWRSALVAAVFAIHPLRAESVAWIAERKDVLSGVFFMLTLWAYARYARRVSRPRYAAMVGAFVLGLLSKNTLVTLPFVLLLLDWWPLQRLRLTTFWELVKEKIPLFLLSAGSCVATILVPEEPMQSSRVQFLERLANAVVSYVIYLRKLVFPVELTIPYFYAPNGLPWWEVALAFVLLTVISITVVACRKRRPYLLVGWFWYLGMLVPMSGIVQMSYNAYADRYTYLPGIGLGLGVAWALGDWSTNWKHRRAILGSLIGVVTGALMVIAWRQTGYWKTSETLWTHAIASSPGNYIAQYNLGDDLVEKGRLDEAMTHYQKAVDINPKSAEAHNNLGLAFYQKGKTNQAIAEYQMALQVNPHLALAHYNLGNIYLQFGKLDDAILQYQQALQSEPDHAVVCVNLGSAFQQKGNLDQAGIYYRRALQINPDDPKAHNNLGEILLQKASLAEAIVHFQKAARLNPGDARAHNNLGSALQQQGRADEAITQYREELMTEPNDAKTQDTLGILLLEKGDADEAITHFQKAIQIDPRNAKAENNLGNAFLQKGNTGEAIAHFERALRITPNEPAIENNLAWIFATSQESSLRNGPKAVELARQADQLSEENPTILRTLAAAYAEAGRFPEALQTAQHALRLAEAQSNSTLATLLQSELELYQAGKAIP